MDNNVFFSFPSIRLEFTLVSFPSNPWWTIIFHIQCMKACKVHHTIVVQMFSGRLCRMVKELKLLAFGLERHAWLLSCTLFFSTNFLVHYFFWRTFLYIIITIVYLCNQLSQYQFAALPSLLIEWSYTTILLIFDEFSSFQDIHVWMNLICLLPVATQGHTIY